MSYQWLLHHLVQLRMPPARGDGSYGCPRGCHSGFLPIFWDAPKSDTYAVQDTGMVVDHLKGHYKFTLNP